MSIPVGVKQAVWAIWGTLAISALGAVIATRLGQTSSGVFLFSLIVYALICIIPYKISNGSNSARYVYLIIFCISVLIMLSGIGKLSKPDLISSIIQFPLEIFAIYKLFQKEASSWFQQSHKPTDIA
ncbi:MAG: hypothetical protein LBQ32_02750 [Burkholderiaceae bacterium]|jgi:uncharacterized membrane protein YoaT (DUF817 family)|nr:hypothetical protein [Burkholderiaceae bacterium]